jgi:hypothetical protein
MTQTILGIVLLGGGMAGLGALVMVWLQRAERGHWG